MENLLTPCILETIIICCTIIALALICVPIFQIHKEKEHRLGTYIFNGSVIVFISTSIFSYLFYGNNQVLDFVSLASAIISIILAVITIVYSFYSNSRSVGQVETLNKAAETVKQATTTYMDSATTLQDNIKKIIDAVNRVEKKTNEILDATKNQNGENDALSQKATNDSSQKNFNVDEYIKTYINIASPLGIMALYACIKSKDNNKPFSLYLFGNDLDVSYCGGFLIAAVSSGLISGDIQLTNNTVLITSYIQTVKESVEQWISTTGKSFDSIQPLKESIDKHFKE